MNKPNPSIVPNTFYRVSVKAIIKNKTGQVLVVKEQHRGASFKPRDHRWELPGGGIDHGESIEEALAREMKEEVGVSATDFNMKPLGNNIRYVEGVPTYTVELFYLVGVGNNFQPKIGEDVVEVAWKDPEVFKNASHIDEQLIYRFGGKQ